MISASVEVHRPPLPWYRWLSRVGPLGASVTVLREREPVRRGPAGPQLTAHDFDGTVRLISKMDRQLSH